jgi:hypothetical protein
MSELPPICKKLTNHSVPPFIVPPYFKVLISPVLSSVLNNISCTKSFPASIAASSEPSLQSSSNFLVTSKLNIISFNSISACCSPLSSITGIPFYVRPSVFSI